MSNNCEMMFLSYESGIYPTEFFFDCHCGGLWDFFSTASNQNTDNAQDGCIIPSIRSHGQSGPCWVLSPRILLHEFPFKTAPNQAPSRWVSWESLPKTHLTWHKVWKESFSSHPRTRENTWPVHTLSKENLLHSFSTSMLLWVGVSNH